MKSIQIVKHDGPQHVEIVDVPEPPRGVGEILIKVEAAGVSFPELLQSRGVYQHQPTLPFIPGAEVSGTVLEAPDGSTLAAGDRVAALVVDGGFAEIATAKEYMTFPLPDSVSYEVGAALPLNYLTCHFALIRRGWLKEGDRVLIHGAAGGVGSAAIQVAKAFGAGQVIAVTSNDHKAEVARQAGADVCVSVADFLAFSKDSGGVDMVVDPVGGGRFTDSLRSLRDDGRLIVVGFAGGGIPTVKVNRLLLNNLTVIGAGWGAYTATRPGYQRRQWDEVLPWIESGAFNPPKISSYPLAEASRALIDLDERRVVGKVVLSTSS